MEEYALFTARLDISRYNEYIRGVKAKAQGGRKGRGETTSPEELAFVDLLRTSDLLTRGVVQALKPADLSPTQYNVLRILRGSKEGLPCGEIAKRMITRDPDITRLLDRLEKRGLISRSREPQDRRMVLTRITPEGLQLLAKLDEPVRELHRRQLGHLRGKSLRKLAVLLQAVRRGEA
jgi:DNA-binding MarR family transcriptional regulator